MRDETNLKRLKREVAKAKALVRQTAIKVDELEASAEEIYRFSERSFLFPRSGKAARPVRLDENVGDFLLT